MGVLTVAPRTGLPRQAETAVWQTVFQPLDDFSWPLLQSGPVDRGYRFYSRLAADRGEMGDGLPPHGVEIGTGAARIFATADGRGTSWAGLWYSLRGTNRESSLLLDLERAFPAPIVPAYQAHVLAWSVKVRGRGRFKIELKDGTGTLLKTWVEEVDTHTYVTRSGLIERTPAPLVAKLLTLVVDSPADLTFDRLGFRLRVRADLSILRYAYLLSYAQLLRCYDQQSGRTKDHAQWPVGDFDTVPGCGFQVLAVATAADLGMVRRREAQQLAKQSIQALLLVPREPHSGWLPHWLQGTQRHPESEWSTVDTALALLSALQGASALGLTQERQALRRIVDTLNFAAVTDPTTMEISHGIDKNGQIIPDTWTAWGGETAVVELLRAYQDPTLPPLGYDRFPPAFCGRGFITELAALFAPAFGAPGCPADRWGVNWYTERMRHLAAQQAAKMGVFFGLSPAEILSREGVTAYLEAGTGTATCLTKDRLPGFGGPWYLPHYLSMSAAVDLSSAERTLEFFHSHGLLPPLSGPPEAVLINPTTGNMQRWHSVQTALNAFFHTIGLYHAIAVAESREDIVYHTVATDARLRAALRVRFPQ